MSAEGGWWILVTIALYTDREPPFRRDISLKEDPFTKRSQADPAGTAPAFGSSGHLHAVGKMPLLQWKKDAGELPGVQWVWILAVNHY